MNTASHLRQILKHQGLMMPGVFNAVAALQAEQTGFQALYISGAAIHNTNGLPDTGILGLEDFMNQIRNICHAVDVPVIADADTGFSNVRRTVQEYERAGLAGLHIEDQISPKRCGHLGGKEICSIDDMQARITLATQARKNNNFMIIARTDARSEEGIQAAIERGGAYLDAGADALFAEALRDEDEFRAFAQAFPDIPLLANMTEFGRTPYFTENQFFDMGYRMIIYPMSALRISMRATEFFYHRLYSEKTQLSEIHDMMTREELYQLLNYVIGEEHMP